MTKYRTPRWGWAITGSGHFLKETLAVVRELERRRPVPQQGGGGGLADVQAGPRPAPIGPRVPRHDRERGAGRPVLLRRLPHRRRRAGDLERGGEIRLRHLGRSRQQRLRAGRQDAASRSSCSPATRAPELRDRSAQGHGQGLSAADRPREPREPRPLRRVPPRSIRPPSSRTAIARRRAEIAA